MYIKRNISIKSEQRSSRDIERQNNKVKVMLWFLKGKSIILEMLRIAKHR